VKRAVLRWRDERTEIRGEGEERAWHRLHYAVAAEECGLGYPSASDGGVFEQRENDMAAAEDKSSGAVEGGEDLQRERGRKAGEQEKTKEGKACG
jgi:hypothetical protein